MCSQKTYTKANSTFVFVLFKAVAVAVPNLIFFSSAKYSQNLKI
jgi:hypothetical protein